MIYFKLMKVFFKENYSLKRILGTDTKTSKTKTVLIIFAIIYAVGAMLATFGFMFFDLGKMLAELGQINMLLDFIFIYSTFLSLFFVLMRANGYLFHYKDFDILQPLPIKSRYVLLAKLSVMLITIYLTIFVIISPIAFSYFYHGGFNLISLIFLIIGLLAVPLLPIVLFSIVSLFIANFASRFRIGKILYVVLLFAFFLGLMYFSFTINLSGGNPLAGQVSLLEAITKYIPSSKWFNQAVHDINILSLLGLVVSSFVLITGFIFLIEDYVIKTNQLGMNVRVRKSNKAAVSKKRGMIKNFLIKEVKKFFNVTIYVFNSGFGPIFMAIGSIAILFFSEEIMGYFSMFGDQTEIRGEVIILLILAFLLSTVFTSAISLSLEGKNFWVIKSLPIKAETVMFGKMLFNILLGMPIAMFAVLMSGLALEFEFISVFVMLLFIASFSLVTSSLGSIINLHFPKFNYVNETEVVKQSLGAFLGMFSAWIILSINGVLYYLLMDNLSVDLIILVNAFVNFLIFSGAVLYIKNSAEKIFQRL